MKKTVLIISTLDTKGQETLYLKDKLSAIGLAPILMDISGRGSDIAEIDIPAARVAESGGGSETPSMVKSDTNTTQVQHGSGDQEEDVSDQVIVPFAMPIVAPRF